MKFINLSYQDITRIILDKLKSSKKHKDMIIADNYYTGFKVDIDNKERVYYNKDRKPIDNPNASNVKIKNNFLRMLVQQKQDYCFAKTFILKLSDEKEKEIDLSLNDYGLAWKKLLDEQLYKLSYWLGGEAVNKGLSWCYVWIDSNGDLKLKPVQSEFIFPVWKDELHTDVERLIYNYYVEEYNNSVTSEYREYAEYWDNKNRLLFDVSDGYTEVKRLTDDGEQLVTHMTLNQSWDKVPFVCMKGTDDEKILLSFVKEYIDSYNVLLSKSIDGLLDDLDPLLVFKGISPNVGDLIEAREIAKMTRTISLDTDGDANYIQAQTMIDSHLRELEVLRHDIIKFGYGVDYEDARFGGNPNQLVIKSLYQNLDTYADGIERHFQDFITNLKYFFDKWYEFTGKGSFEECQKYNVMIKLDRSMMINQTEQIENAIKLSSSGVSQQTLLEYNPVVQDVEMELERIRKENENKLFDFPDDE